MPRQPNILFILTDQQRRDSLAAYGNDWIEAPNIDGLAQRSIVFDNAYVTQPVCTPSRASIMTGMYPQSTGLIGNGIHLRADTPTIAEMISEDYLCAHYGKWHLGNDLVPQHGFEVWRSIEDWHLNAGTTTRKEHRFLESDYNAWLLSHGVEPPSGQSYETWFPTAGLSAEQTQAGYLGDEASRFIREHAESQHRDRPFMLFTSFFEPHPPYTGPLNGLYDPASLPVGPAFMQHPEGGSLVNRLRAEHYLSGGLNPLAEKGGDIHDTTNEEGWRKLRSQYFANVTLVDRNVGRILSALEESGQADNTIIVFTSEHGEMAGDHGMLEKRSMYEEATRVPLFIHVPWLSDGTRRIGGSVSLIDLVPTPARPRGRSDTRSHRGFQPRARDSRRRDARRQRCLPSVERLRRPESRQPCHQPHGLGPLAFGRHGRPLEAKPQPRRSVRAIRPQLRPPRDAQPLQRPRPP